MWRPDDIVRHPTCRRLIGTSQTVQAARNFDVRCNYRTNKSLKSKHGSSGGVGGVGGAEEAVWRAPVRQAAACRLDSIIAS